MWWDIHSQHCMRHHVCARYQHACMSVNHSGICLDVVKVPASRLPPSSTFLLHGVAGDNDGMPRDAAGMVKAQAEEQACQVSQASQATTAGIREQSGSQQTSPCAACLSAHEPIPDMLDVLIGLLSAFASATDALPAGHPFLYGK